MGLKRFTWLAAAAVMFVLIAGTDITAAKLFYNHGQFYLNDGIVGWMIELGLPALLVLLGVAVFAVWLAGRFRGRQIGPVDTKFMLMTFGTMCVGPGLIVNGVFKGFWGRARPYEIIELGGNKLFSPALAISDQCHWDCSFVSGHTAIGFWLLSCALLAPEKYRRRAVAAAVCFGMLLGAARIAQGMHFVSDVAGAALVTVAVVVIAYRMLYGEEKN